jgi:hypothetical protein
MKKELGQARVGLADPLACPGSYPLAWVSRETTRANPGFFDYRRAPRRRRFTYATTVPISRNPIVAGSGTGATKDVATPLP